MRSDNRAEKEQKHKKRRKKRYTLKLIIFLALCVIAFAVAHISYFDLKGIAVMGNETISDEEIIKLSKIEVGKSVFDAHPFFAENRIEDNLYVEKADVKRNLPDGVVITITEKTGLVQFPMGKKYVVMDQEKKVVEIAKEKRPVTYVDNIKVLNAKKGKKIKVKEEGRLDNTLEFMKLVEKGDLYFSSLTMTKSKVEGVFYGGLRCQGGYENVVEVIKDGTLKSVVYTLYQKGKENGVITVSSNNYCFFTPEK